MSQYSSIISIRANVQPDDERRGKLCWLLCGTTHTYVEVLQLFGAVQRTERYANVLCDRSILDGSTVQYVK